MFICPHCNKPLVRKLGTNGVFWCCELCGGRAVGMALLRKTIGDKPVTEIWATTLKSPDQQGCRCPICSRGMVEIIVPVAEKSMELDVCRRCEFVWFDRNEYEAFPPAPLKPRALGDIDESKLSPAARELLAMRKVEEIAKQAQAQDQELDENWKALPAVLGLPVEMESSPMNRIPWVTYILSGLIATVSIGAFFDLHNIIARFGLIPEQAGRYYGLTFVTSFFLHADPVHLLGNLYFLLVFGRAVENFLGWSRCLLLVVLSDLFGNFLHIMIDPHQTLPCIGASGGISGLIAFYALKFPHAQIGILLRFYYWIRFPAWGAFLLWVSFQVWGVYTQMAGISHVSSLAHLGGVVVGIIFWGIWQNLDLQPLAVPALIKVKPS